jgi:hypothetical protein
MIKIILTDDQLNLLRQSVGPAEVCDSTGKVLGTVNPELRHEFLQELKRRAAVPGPWYSGDEIQGLLGFLEEAWSKEGGFDEHRMQHLIKEFDAQAGPKP